MFGWIHVLSVALSFASVLCSAVAFNELESPNPGGDASAEAIMDMEDDDDDQEVARRCTPNLAARLSVAVPFFLFTLGYRAVGLSLAVCFTKYWAGVLIFGYDCPFTSQYTI